MQGCTPDLLPLTPSTRSPLPRTRPCDPVRGGKVLLAVTVHLTSRDVAPLRPLFGSFRPQTRTATGSVTLPSQSRLQAQVPENRDAHEKENERPPRTRTAPLRTSPAVPCPGRWSGAGEACPPHPVLGPRLQEGIPPGGIPRKPPLTQLVVQRGKGGSIELKGSKVQTRVCARVSSRAWLSMLVCGASGERWAEEQNPTLGHTHSGLANRSQGCKRGRQLDQLPKCCHKAI